MSKFFQTFFLITFNLISTVIASDTNENISGSETTRLTSDICEDYNTGKFLLLFNQEHISEEIISGINSRTLGRFRQVSKALHTQIDKKLKIKSVGLKVLKNDLTEYGHTHSIFINMQSEKLNKRANELLEGAYLLLSKLNNMIKLSKDFNKYFNCYLNAISNTTPDWVKKFFPEIEKQFIQPVFEHYILKTSRRALDWKVISKNFEKINFKDSAFPLKPFPLLLSTALNNGFIISKNLFLSMCESGLPESYPLIELALKHNYDIHQNWDNPRTNSRKSLISLLNDRYRVANSMATKFIPGSETVAPNILNIMQLLVQKGADTSEITDSPLFKLLTEAPEI